MSDSSAWVDVRYRVRPSADAWILPEVPVPESRPHDKLLSHLVALLEAWVARTELDAIAGRNLAVRWVEANPKIGIDPDVALITPAPPQAQELQSLCTWKPGHVVPRLAIEVVSKHHPYKDYRDLHERYGASGVGELWVLDPEGHGPKSLGGPVPIQQWVRRERIFERVHFGAGPIYSEVIGAWLWADPIRITDDGDGKRVWLTATETERLEKEAERAAKEAERAAKEAERVAKEAALADKEAERVAKEAALADKEAERVAKEAALAEKEAERVAKEAALAEKEAERVAKEAALAASEAAVAKRDAAAARIAELERQVAQLKGG
ncbi:MAG: Uma2 family endonuclease [Polyangiaceae bacterium]